jgi:hypothetical protein
VILVLCIACGAPVEACACDLKEEVVVELPPAAADGAPEAEEPSS